MKYSKKEIGKELLKELEKGYNVERISNWACDLWTSIRGNANKELENILNNIIMMDAGPEFEFKEEELRLLADRLIFEGDEEELSKPISEVKVRAELLDQHWLMCPLCHEAWEDRSVYGMVRCPKCDNILHNPNYTSEKM